MTKTNDALPKTELVAMKLLYPHMGGKNDAGTTVSMSLYKVRIKAEIDDGFFGLFNKKIETVEFVEADSAQEAKEKMEREIRIRIDSDEASVYVADVELSR